MSIRILNTDALSGLRSLPDESIQCVVTSPPYWGLRSYKGDPGMIGLEPTLDEHIANLVAVFREVRRVLRKDGTVWLNYGDAYAAQKPGVCSGDPMKTSGLAGDKTAQIAREQKADTLKGSGLKPKDLMLLPARVALALQSDGWWVRSEIIWHKPNPMPESVTDRPTSAHEKVFLLTRSSKYFYDAEAVRVPLATQPHAPGNKKLDSSRNDHDSMQKVWGSESGANLRNVWTIPTFGLKEAHFATFPPALVEPCIKAGTSEKGCCSVCGAPWVRLVKSTTRFESGSGKAGNVPNGKHAGTEQAESGTYDIRMGPVKETTTTGWQPTCSCDAPIEPCVVLDPFGGAGTVGLVADRLGRDAILIEISSEYADMARRRIEGDNPLFARVS